MKPRIEESAENPLYELEELVAEANRLLPRYLPEQVADARVRAEVNARLVRHLTTIGVLDEALRAGREARYSRRHLMQLLAARRLMAQGYATGAIRQLLREADAARLEAIVSGGARVEVQAEAPREVVFSQRLDLALPPASVAEPPASAAPRAEPNAALSFLRGVKARGAAKNEAPEAVTFASPSAPPQAARAEVWRRYEVRPGLELHVREDYVAPPTPHERDGVLGRVEAILKGLALRGARSKRR